uniref:Odorant receptor n=1 Tax=Apolygus lucorum TaxID=248454 RepID=A0A1Q1NIN7_APOLU|nr:olfactory receptor [Apolygus lucorum]
MNTEVTERFEYASKAYWGALGFTGLDAFLYEKPPKHNVLRWYAFRIIYIYFVFVHYPIFITMQFWGIVTAESHTLMQISFDISLMGYNIQNIIKLLIWMIRIKTVRSLRLNFSKFNVNKYRPKLSSWIIKRDAENALKFTGRCYWISYANLLFWVVLPTATAIINYSTYLAGYADWQENDFPRYSNTRFPFDLSQHRSQVIVSFLEVILFTLGFMSFQSMDMFFSVIIRMAQAQFSVLNSALFALDGELDKFWGTEVPVNDCKPPMKIHLIVQDHQRMIRYGVRLRKFLSPILGLETLNCITIICNMTIVASSQVSGGGEFLEVALAAFASSLVVITCLVVFFTFTSMTGQLKDAEESVFYAMYSSKWYERDVSHRKSIILMQKQAMTSRRIKMFGLGDMGRSTFIDGLRMVYTYYNFMQRFK